MCIRDRTYCDDYVELVKARAYGETTNPAAAASARSALGTSLGVLLRCFAPFLPYCTEEAWSWWHDGSVHRAPWPLESDLLDAAGAGPRTELLGAVSEVLGSIRRAKSEAHRSMREPVVSCTVSGPSQLAELVALEMCIRDRYGTRPMVTPRIPDRPSLDGLEAKWSKRWESDGTYHFDRSKDRSEVYSIDTPPPTVSGSLHTGHVFSYSQTDMVARFQRCLLYTSRCV